MAFSFARSVARRGWLLALVVAIAGIGCTSSTTSCPAGQTACGGSCVDLATDPLHCGACNITCDAGAGCSAGLCTCPPDKPVTCASSCVNVQTDAANCGACGHSCGLGTCSGAACTCDAPSPPIVLCPNGDPTTDTCVNTDSSGSNCGGCNIVCVAAKVCSAGTCQCLPPNTTCQVGTPSEVCTNTQTDPENCGACGIACAAGYTCSAGTCRLVCSTGLTNCNGTCVDTRADPVNCGACGNVCGSGKSCVNGACQATCTTLECGGACCEAAKIGNACCPTAGSETCPQVHKNFIGTQVQTYYTCTPSYTYDVETAKFASGTWADDFGLPIATRRTCPDSGGSLCVVRQKGIGVDAACGVWCYDGPLSATLKVTQGYNCLCPLQQQTDWY